MSTLKRRTAQAIVNNRFAWHLISSCLGPLSRAFDRLSHLHEDPLGQSDAQEVHRFCTELFQGLTVLNGPMRGLKYPGASAIGSAYYPKILGSYESELHDVITSFPRRSYDAVVDIGCAEGYYAVGLGRLLPHARIFAYDTDANALKHCHEMAKLNQVDVKIGGFCDQRELRRLDLGGRALIFSDCEGYEGKLFDATLVEDLQRHDFLIETHDFIEIGTTQRLLECFGETHDCDVIQSVDDIDKVSAYEYPELQSLTLTQKRLVLAEYRPHVMRWIFAKSRHHSDAYQAAALLIGNESSQS